MPFILLALLQVKGGAFWLVSIVKGLVWGSKVERALRSRAPIAKTKSGSY